MGSNCSCRERKQIGFLYYPDNLGQTSLNLSSTLFWPGHNAAGMLLFFSSLVLDQSTLCCFGCCQTGLEKYFDLTWGMYYREVSGKSCCKLTLFSSFPLLLIGASTCMLIIHYVFCPMFSIYEIRNS